VIPCAEGDADSRSDSNTSVHQSNLAHGDDHRYRMDHALTHGCPYLIREEVRGSSPRRPTQVTALMPGRVPGILA
jgi:hypothetical protein